MADFLQGAKLNSAIQEIFEKAENDLILISPYIKLHHRLKSSLRAKINDVSLELVIVFGKNEENISKSLGKEDFEFLKEFPNIKILYEKRLHAKYYANEKRGILTSMNLYSYSQDNNIEFGVLTEGKSLLRNDKLDMDAWEYFKTVIDQAEPYFIKNPVYNKSGLLGIKKYTNSETKLDKLTEIYEKEPSKNNNGFKKKNNLSSNRYDPQNKNQYGYCIRTGIKIPFNPNKPLSNNAFENWNKYKDEKYPEKYCHFSGEASDGQTSFAKPILKKNWNEAKNIFNL